MITCKQINKITSDTPGEQKENNKVECSGLEWLGWQVYVMILGKASPKGDL